MSGQDLELTLRLKADRSGLRGEIRMTKADIEQLTKQMDDAGKEADQTSKQMDKLGKKTKEAGDKGKFFSRTVKDLVGDLTSVKGIMAALGIAVGAVIASVVATNVEFSDLRANLVTFTSSTQAANAQFRELQDLAATTPYSVQELTNSFNKLVALGLNPSEAALISYGNTAAAMGKQLDQMVEAVADAAVGEFERLKEFGVKANSLGDQVAFTFRGMTTIVRNSSQEIQEYLQDIGNTDFAGAMDRRAATLGGAISNLGDSWDNLQDKFLGSALESVISGIIRLFSMLLDVIGYVMDGINWLLDVPFEGVTKIINIATGNVGELGAAAQTTGAQLSNELAGGANQATQSIAGLNRELVESSVGMVGLTYAQTKVRMVELQRQIEVTEKSMAGFKQMFKNTLDLETFNRVVAENDRQLELWRTQLDTASLQEVVLRESLMRLSDEMGKNKTAIADHSKQATLAIKAQSKWMDDLLDSYIKEEEENAKLFDIKEQLIKSLKDELELTQYTGRELAIQTKIRANHARGIYDQDAAIRQLAGSIYDANAAAKAAEEQADPFADAWAEATKRIDESFADAWRGAFDSFDAFSRSLLQAFQNLLAELAHQAITKPILISLGLGGGMVGGTASAATGGTGGSLQQAGFSSITDSLGIGNMFSGGVGLSSLSTMASYGLSAGSGGLLAGATQGGMLAAQTAEFGLSGAMLTSDALGGAAAAGGGLSGALAAAAPWLMAAAFIAPLIGGMLKGGTPHLGGMTEFDMSGGTTNIDRNAWGGDATGIPSWVFTPVGQDNRFGEPLDVLGQTSIAAINQALAAAGLSADGLNLRYGFAADGEDPTGGYGAVMMGGDVVFDSFARYAKDAEQGFEQFASDILPKVVNAALAAAVKSSDWMDDLKALALSFEGSDSFAEVVAAFGTLQEYLNTDPIEAYQTAVEASSRTLWDSMQTQYNSVMDLANAYDGSAASATSLAHNTQAFFQTTMQMLAQLDAAQNSINMTIGNAVEQITLSRMTDQEKYDYYRGAVDDLVALLPTLTDSTTINQTVSDITQAAKAAYGLLSPEQQIGSMGDQILGLLSGGYTDEEGNHIGVQEMANQLINDTRDSVVTMTETLGDTIDQKLKEAAAEFKAAAAQNQQAADTNTAAANNMGAGIDRLLAWANDLLPNDDRTVWLPSVGGR